jgi:hypothetical protein
MSLDFIFQILQPLFLIKIVAIIFLVMILIFVIIVSKQVTEMNEDINAGASSRTAQLLSFFNILLVLSLLLTAIAIL